MPEPVVLPDRAAWLEGRGRGIGSSDSPAILGVSPWQSPLALYVQKLGIGDLRQENEAMAWGNLLEPIIADRYQHVTDRELKDHGRFTIYRAPEPPMLTTLDREILGDARGPGVLEIKNVSAWKADEWLTEPPLMYQVQVQHAMAVMGWSWGSLAALLGGNRLVWFDVERNDRFIAALRVAVAEFWERLLTLTPPPVDASESSRRALTVLYPKDDGLTIALPVEAAEWTREVEEAQAEEKAAKAKRQEAEAKILGELGSATYGLLADGTKWSWKFQRREMPALPARVDEFRQLRRLKGRNA